MTNKTIEEKLKNFCKHFDWEMDSEQIHEIRKFVDELQAALQSQMPSCSEFCEKFEYYKTHLNGSIGFFNWLRDNTKPKERTMPSFESFRESEQLMRRKTGKDAPMDAYWAYDWIKAARAR